jgi:hypothetical protein
MNTWDPGRADHDDAGEARDKSYPEESGVESRLGGTPQYGERPEEQPGADDLGNVAEGRCNIASQCQRKR